MTKFSIAGKIYDAVDTTKLSMRDMLLFEQETAAFGVPLTWADVTGWHADVAALETDAEREKHPRALWLAAVSVWAARKAAGEQVTFDQAIDIKVDDLVFLPDPGDHRKAAPKAKARTSRAASVPAESPDQPE